MFSYMWILAFNVCYVHICGMNVGIGHEMTGRKEVLRKVG